ncbi:MAG: alpha-ketoglutarate-dependent dioxygenase AlkB [Sphaerospermopsis sp. SIO1G2]|nr:alpha-ketoglutarate-dependent dioxygenase AlkB [Sphaerospermopsis sp. SIO1G2]
MTNYQTQANLFEDHSENAFQNISGLAYISNYITPEQEVKLLTIIDKQPWLTDLKRRVQHYGWKYDYTVRRVDESMRLGSLPDWLMEHCQRLHDNGYFPKLPDQVIINEYQPGQGTASHTDCIPCFEETIASISLGSPCVMDFTHSEMKEKVSVPLEPCSLFILKGDARYKWKHSIAARKTDKVDGQAIQRDRRISLTFRNVILSEACK